MNKQELVAVLSKKTNLPKTKCDLFLNTFKDTILEVCNKGGEIVLRDFGKFTLKERNPRKYLNPQTKRYYMASSKRFVSFKSFASLAKGLN